VQTFFGSLNSASTNASEYGYGWTDPSAARSHKSASWHPTHLLAARLSGARSIAVHDGQMTEIDDHLAAVAAERHRIERELNILADTRFRA